MGKYATTLLGDPPSPETLEFRQWSDDLRAIREARVPLERGTTYYFSQEGDDTTGDGTRGKPFKTRVKAITLVSDDVRLRFKRGDVFTEAGFDWIITASNVTVDDYGPEVLPKPLFNAFILQYPAGGGGWTLSSGTTYYRTEANDVAWVRRVDYRDYLLTPARGSSSTLAMGKWGQFWYDLDATRLYVNFGCDPNTLDIEAVPSNILNGIKASGDNIRVENIRAHGWGCSRPFTDTQRHGIAAAPHDTGEVLLVGCESYFSASHAMAHILFSDTLQSGGISTWIDCKSGYTKWHPGGETVFNFYAKEDHECVAFDCEVTHGTLPSDDWDYATDGRRAEAFYGHSGEDGLYAKLYMHSGTKISYPGNGYGANTDGYFNPNSVVQATTPGESRAFLIGTQAACLRYAGIGFPNEVSVGCYKRMQTFAGQANNLGVAQGGWQFNCAWEFDIRLQAESTFFNIVGNVAQTFKVYNSQFRILADDPTGAKVISIEAFGSPLLYDNSLIANTIIEVNNGFYGNLFYKNNAANLKNNAYYGLGNEVSVIGFDADAGRVHLAAPVGVLADVAEGGQLDGTGDATYAPEYDYSENVRSRTSVSIGPVDVSESAVYPDESDVRLSVMYGPDGNNFTGTFVPEINASGDGDTVVDHDTGGTDTLRVVVAGQGVDGVVIRAYVKTEYDADATTATVRGKAVTGSDGRWVVPMYLNSGVAYTLTFHAASGYLVQTVDVTP